MNDQPSRIPVSLNLNVRGLPPSATLAINARSRELAAAGRDIFRFGLGQSPFPVPDPVVRSLREHAHEKDYLPVEGLPALCEAVANFHRRHEGVDVDGSCVLIGPGSKELMFLLQLVYYGDLVVPTPCWVSYGPQARILGRKVVRLPTTYDERWRLTASRLAGHCRDDAARPRVVILNYPGNPDGASYNEDELRAIAEVARDNGVILLSDEIYGHLHHRGEHVSIARFYPEGTIISGGLSKWCGAGGWRLGTFTFPRGLSWLRKAMAAVASETYTSVSAPIQYAAVTGFDEGPEIEDYLDQSRRILRALASFITTTISSAGARMHPPEGAFYCTIDISPLAAGLAERGITTSRKLCEKLLDDTGVAILPGADFERPDDELVARLAYVDFDGGPAIEAARTVTTGELGDDFCREHCPRVTRGIEAFAAWLVEHGSRR